MSTGRGVGGGTVSDFLVEWEGRGEGGVHCSRFIQRGRGGAVFFFFFGWGGVHCSRLLGGWGVGHTFFLAIIQFI